MKVHVKLKPNTLHIYRKFYEIPIHLRDKVYQQLGNLEKLGIITPIKFTPWATPLVVVKKKNTEVKSCLDL